MKPVFALAAALFIAVTGATAGTGAVKGVAAPLVSATPSLQVCKTNAACGNGYFCEVPAPYDADKAGVCARRPLTCAKDRRWVCGANGRVYHSACEANRAGVNAAYAGICRLPKPVDMYRV